MDEGDSVAGVIEFLNSHWLKFKRILVESRGQQRGMEERYEFEEVNLLSIFAVGVPGKRTFFLAIGEKEDWMRLWLEKEQLEALHLAISQFLFTLSKEYNLSPDKAEESSLSDDSPSGLPSAELELDQITLGFDHGKVTLDFIVHGMGPKAEIASEVNCQTTLAQLKKLGNRANSICTAGRPRCELCGGPIDPSGHDCPMHN